MKAFFIRYFPSQITWFIVLMWLVFAIDALTPFFNFNHLGIRPRQIMGLIGVIASPFLHSGMPHIMANTVGLVLAGLILRLSYNSSQMIVILVVGALLSGGLTWVISSPAIVVGASGVVFCLIGVLLANAFFNPSLLSWLQAWLCFIFYSGAIMSLFGLEEGISWAAHFSGLISGFILSFLINKKRTK